MAESWYDVGPRYSYLGVPAPAGVNEWREDGRLPPRAETEKCSAGACPQLGVGWAAQTTPDPSINQRPPNLTP